MWFIYKYLLSVFDVWDMMGNTGESSSLLTKHLESSDLIGSV